MAEIPGATPFDPEGLLDMKPEHLGVFASLSHSMYFRVLFPENYHVESDTLEEDRRRIYDEYNVLSASADSIFRPFKASVREDASLLGTNFIVKELFQRHIPLMVMAGDDLRSLLAEALQLDKKFSPEDRYHRGFFNFFNTLCSAYNAKAFAEFTDDYDKKIALDSVVRRSFMFGLDIFSLISKNREDILGKPVLDDVIFRNWFEDIDFE